MNTVLKYISPKNKMTSEPQRQVSQAHQTTWEDYFHWLYVWEATRLVREGKICTRWYDAGGGLY